VMALAEADAPETTTNVQVIRHPDGHKRVNQYRVERTLGRGSFGKVKLCTNEQTGQLFAVKIMNRSLLKRRRVGMTPMLQTVFREIALMKKLRHPNVLRLYEAMDDPDQDNIFMILEYIDNGAVMSGQMEQDPLPADKCRNHFRQLLLGLRYLHRNNIVHRDIKPENLLLTSSGVLKVADFGVSHMFESAGDDTMTVTAGTPAFQAPECCGTSKMAFRGQPVDVWAAGVCLYMFSFGRIPFVGANLMDQYRCIREDELKIPEGADPLLMDILLRMLEKDPEKRITVDALFAHDWVTQKGSCPLDDTIEASPALVVSDDEVSAALTQTEKFVLLVKVKRRMSALKREAQTRLQRSRANSSEGSEQLPPPSQQAIEEALSSTGVTEEKPRTVKTKNKCVMM